MSEPVTAEKFAIGQSVRRVEDPRLVTGFGRYSDDVNLPRQAYAVVVRSPHAHAAIRSIDTSAARRARGGRLRAPAVGRGDGRRHPPGCAGCLARGPR